MKPILDRKQTPTDKRTTRTLDRNRDGRRGATGIDRRERKQGVALDERGQEQPADRNRARAPQEGETTSSPRRQHKD